MRNQKLTHSFDPALMATIANSDFPARLLAAIKISQDYHAEKKKKESQSSQVNTQEND